MRRTILIAALSAGLAAAAPAARAQDQPPPGGPGAVSFDDVLRMVGQGKDAPAVLAACDTIFTFSPEQRDKLLKTGASPALIDALQRKRMSLGDVRNVVVILDCSGSMSDLMPDGRTKMAAAQRVVADVVDAVPAGRNLCLIIYGHHVKKGQECQAVEVVRELGPLQAEDRAALKQLVGRLKPTGHTPIANSLIAAGKALDKAEGLCQVVLITDGEETCHGNPAAEAERLALRENVRAVEVVGLGLTDKEKEGVRDIARRGRGRFYDAKDAKVLAEAVAEAAVVKVPPKAPADPPAEPPVTKKRPIPADLPKAVRMLIEDLSDPDAAQRATAAEALAKHKHEAVVEALCEALQDKDGRVRRAAADSLARIGDRAAAGPLAKRVADEVWVPQPKGSVSYNPKDPPAFDGLKEGWGSKDHALVALRKVAPDEAAAALAAALKAKTPEVRRWAARELGAQKGEAATAALVAALTDADGQVRRAAADSLAKVGDKSEAVVEALIKRVADGTWVARPKGTIWFNPDDPPAYDDEKDWGSKHHALQALRKLAPDRVEEALTLALRVKDAPEVRKWAARQLGGGKGP